MTKLAKHISCYGFRLIVSHKQADQILRRELKWIAKTRQRYQHHIVDFDLLLAIKPGNWFKFRRKDQPTWPRYSVAIWRSPQ